MFNYRVQLNNSIPLVRIEAEKMEVMWSDNAKGDHWLQFDDEDGNTTAIFPLVNIVSAVRVDDGG